MQHGFVLARKRIVTFQTPADYFLTLCFPLILKGIFRDTPMIYQRLYKVLVFLNLSHSNFGMHREKSPTCVRK